MVKSEPRAQRDDRPPVVITDPRSIKALAHPARLAVLTELFAGRRLTATECADIAGLSPSAMSYHLRALEKWGIIERAEGSGDGRERPWKSSGRGLRIESSDSRVSSAAESAFMAQLLDGMRRDVIEWVNADDRDAGWDDVTTIASSGRWLTVEQARQFSAEVTAIFEKYRVDDEDAAEPGARRVRTSFVLVPVEQR